MRAPLSRSRPPFSSGAACQSATMPLVGGLGLRGELPLGLAHPLVGDPDAGRLALARRRAGGDLEPAQLLGGQRRLLVGVVLAAGEQAPEQARELARGRDDRLAVPAAGADALIERAQRAGLADGPPGAPRPAPSARRPSPAWRSGRRAPAGCRTGGRAGQARGRPTSLRDCRNRRMSPIAARNVAAQITLTPGTVISRRDLGRLERLTRDQSLDRGDLCVQELDVAHAAVDRLALLERQLEPAQPPRGP